MSSQRTAWHFHFTLVIRDGRCSWVDFRDEVALSEERQRMDYLFMRRVKDPSPTDTGKTLKRMWPLIPQEAVAEFKSIGRPYRDRSLDRLFGYLHTYYADNSKLTSHADLAGFLIVPCRTPTLDTDVREMRLAYRDMDEGYWELTGGVFRMYVIEIDRVGDTEPDGVLKSFGHCEKLTDEAQQFWANQLGTKEANVDAAKLEGHKEIVARFLASMPVDERLEGLSEDELLSHVSRQTLASKLTRQERLAGLSREECLLALPDDDLRALPDSFLATFSESFREAVRKRIAK